MAGVRLNVRLNEPASERKYDKESVVREFRIYQNYPNPFNPSTNIRFDVPKSSFVTLKVYDALGREITQLVNEELKPGSYSVDFDGNSMSSGVYFYRITAGTFKETKKMVLLK